jgi:hypothetical protein
LCSAPHLGGASFFLVDLPQIRPRTFVSFLRRLLDGPLLVRPTDSSFEISGKTRLAALMPASEPLASLRGGPQGTSSVCYNKDLG